MVERDAGIDNPDALQLVAELHRAGDGVRDAIVRYQASLAQADRLEDELEIRLRLAGCLIQVREYQAVDAMLDPILMGTDVPPTVRAEALVCAGRAALFLGRPDRCVSACREACTLLLKTSQHDSLAQALRWLGHGYRFTGRTKEAADSFRDALASARRGEDPTQQNFCLDALAQLSRLNGRYSEAIEYSLQSLALNEHRGARKPIAFDCLHIGLARIYRGEWSAARESLDRATQIFSGLGDDRAQIPVLIARARLDRRCGDLPSAWQHADRAMTLARESSYKRATVLAREEMADNLLQRGDPEQAASLLEVALADGTSIAPEGDLVYEVAWRLAIAVLAGNAARAEELGRLALRLAAAAGDRRETGNACVALARVLSRIGRNGEAADLAHQGLLEFEAIEAPFELAGAHEALAEALRTNQDRVADVLAHLLEARRLYARLGSVSEVERLDGLVAAHSTPGASRRRRPEPTVEAAALSFDPATTALFSTARDLAPYDTTVLIEGETGAGKEIVARLLHDAGPRASRPFAALNCAAFPAALLESELFGHRRGAFTGADRDYRGRLAAAEDGTVLLDEIDKASPEFQAKLLRVIEDRRVFPVGSTESVPLRARLVCATNRDLRTHAENGLFLHDLYFRLAAFRLRIPPLRERPEDIRGFVRHYLDACVGRFGSDSYDVSRDAMTALLAYPWPGNVRELKNVMESAAFFARLGGVIELAHLPPEIVDAVGQPGHASLPERLEEIERSQIEMALNKTGGNKSVAARMLGVSRKGLLDRIRRLGME